MNYKAIKERMDKFLSETTAEYLMKQFEDLGYSFIKTNIPYTDSPTDYTYHYPSSSPCEEEESGFDKIKHFFKRKQNNSTK